jgi:streptomycin 6-kinase
MDRYGRNLPPEFRRRFIETFGAGAERWLDELPRLLSGCERRWDLRLEPPFPPSYGYAAPAVRADRSAAVVKARFPNSEARDEIEALRAFAGEAAVRLIDADASGAVMLLERIRPGTMLKDLSDDDQATAIAARIMSSLRRPAPAGHAFPTVRDWWEKAAADVRARFSGSAGPLPAGLFARAEETFLGADPSGWPLLHGDVHHENILRDERRGWLVIDPQGVLGDRAYETGTFLRNQLPEGSGARAMLDRRIDILADGLEMERARIIEWAMAHNVMSACWTLVSHGAGWEGAIAVAEMLRELGGLRSTTDR